MFAWSASSRASHVAASSPVSSGHRALGQLEVVRGVRGVEGLPLRVVEAPGCVFPDRAEQQAAVRADRLHEARVGEGREGVEVGVGDLLGRVDAERVANTANLAKSAWASGSSRS